MIGYLLIGVAAIAAYELFKPKHLPAGIGAPGQPGNMMTVQGRSGNMWGVAQNMNPQPVGPGVSVMDVYTLTSGPGAIGGVKVLSYAQQGSDMNSRVFLTSVLPPSDPRVPAARADFGI